MRAPPRFAHTVLRQLRSLARLALPVVVSRAGILIMASVDVAMVGRYSTRELNFISLGVSIFVPVIVTCVGLLLGVSALVSRHYGRGDKVACGEVWRRAFTRTLLLAIAGATLCAMGEIWLTLFGHSAEMARGGGLVARALAPGLLANVIYVNCTFFMEATHRPLPGMVLMLLANIANLFGNWLLIGGEMGFPALGALGSAIVTSTIRVAMLVVMLTFILFNREAAEYGLWRPLPKGPWKESAEVTRIGLAAGASSAIETSSFAALIQFAGMAGAVELAVFTILYNFEGLIFMIALGMSSATGVLVGNAFGRRNGAEIRLAGWTGILATAALAAFCALATLLAAEEIAALYTRDPELRFRVVPLLLLLPFIMVCDGAQLAANQSVRALGDAWFATGLHIISFWIIMVPLAWYLAIVHAMGSLGLLLAGVAGAASSALLQGRRFHRLAHRAGERRT